MNDRWSSKRQPARLQWSGRHRELLARYDTVHAPRTGTSWWSGPGRDQEVSCVEKKNNVLHSTKRGLYTSLLFCLLSAGYSEVCILLVLLSYGLGAEGAEHETTGESWIIFKVLFLFDLKQFKTLLLGKIIYTTEFLRQKMKLQNNYWLEKGPYELLPLYPRVYEFILRFKGLEAKEQ